MFIISNSLSRSGIQKGIRDLRMQSDVNWGCSPMKTCLGLADPLPSCFNLKTIS